MKEVKTIDARKYVALQASVDEIGRMLGGWIRSTRETGSPGARPGHQN